MLPLESFKYGGLWWFSDITLPDQYFILPVITVITLGVTLEVLCVTTQIVCIYIDLFFFQTF